MCYLDGNYLNKKSSFVFNVKFYDMKSLAMLEAEITANKKLQPYFSVIITTYNRAQLLKRALDSLIAQTEPDWEAIIVDDESTDDTYDQIIPYLRSFKQIKYYKKKHGGEVATKNAGISFSTGKFITFLDSDDEYDPDHLKTRKLILGFNPSVRFLYGGVHIIGNQYVPDRFDYSRRINLNECIIGGTFFIERLTLIKLNGYAEITLGTDADLFERARKKEIPVMETKIPTYIYHHENEDSITNNLTKSNLQSVPSNLNA
jgi:glycosyltransferase involved in cell wall biosynthesis